jgi:hypothetical protein
MSVGRQADVNGYLDVSDVRAIIAPIVVAPYIAIVIVKIYNELEKITYDIDSERIGNKELVVYFIFLIICWGIVLLGVYPGFFVYDATDEIIEVITRNFNTHHPLLHVLFMGGIVQAGYKIFGNYNVGIFIFTFIQMVAFAIGVVWTVYKMSVFKFGKKLCRVTILFMGLFPVIPMIVLCSCKDSAFALVVLIWLVETYDLMYMGNSKAAYSWCVFTVLMCLLRNNAIYALLVSGILIIILLKSERKKYIIMFTGSIAVALCISAMLGMVLKASESENQEMLTVPIQQIARTYNLDENAFNDDEKELLYEYIPREYLEKYRVKLSDGVKIGFVNSKYEDDKTGFWRIWFRGLIKSPISYLNAWIMTSYGYWYPDTVVDVYSGNEVYTFTYDENSFFAYETEYPGQRDSLIPVIDNFYKKLSLDIYKEKLPVLSMLFSMGAIFWVWVFLIGYVVKNRGIRGILPYIMPIMTWCTFLLGPTYLPRYIFFMWLGIPFIVGDSCKRMGNRDGEC